MRKNSPRKWLHACLDLLPVILIPVFMIYSHRHDVTETTTINYKYESNEVNTIDDIIPGNIYFTERLSVGDDCAKFSIILLQYDYASLTVGNFEDFATSEFTNNESVLWIKFDSSIRPYGIRYYFTNLNTYVKMLDSEDVYADFDNVIFYIPTNLDQTTLDLTLSLFEDSYGFGNTMPQYTDYNVIESVDIVNTDVMDSFMNHFNNTIDNHFNMGNVFNLTGVYQWFNTNIFNGNAPQVIYSVWNIALYELVMDLLFLLYGLFMWFIDIVQHLMDKPFKSIK